jgi:ankyrin repeat protein
VAAWRDDLASLALLLACGASPALARDHEGRTCLHLAASNDSVAAVTALLECKVPGGVARWCLLYCPTN